MAKPTDLPRWADTVAADPTKVNEPPNAKKDVGWVTAEKPPAQWLNWLAFTIYTWVIWLRDFEITAHVWTALQTLNFGVVVTQGTANADGTTTTGNGTGAGIRARGGATGRGVLGIAGTGATTAPGVHGQGDTTGAAGGPGVLGEGGTNGAGGTFTGNGTAAGVLATGGATNGPGTVSAGTGSGEGVRGTGGATNGIGVVAIGGATNGVALRAESSGSGVTVSAKTSSTNAAAALPGAMIDALDGGNRHRFIVDQLGLPGGRISRIAENWLFEAAFTGAAGGQLIPSSLYWYSDISAAMVGSVNTGNASGVSDALSVFGSVRDCTLLYSGNATQYNIAYSSQLFGTRANACIVITYEVLAIEGVVGNEYRTGVLEIVAPLVGALANHDPSTASNRMVLVYQNGVNGNKWGIEWVQNGVADALVDTGIAITDPLTVRIELIGSDYGGPFTRLFVNGQRFINKSGFLGGASPAPLGFCHAIFGKVVAGSSTLRISPLEIVAARTAGAHTL